MTITQSIFLRAYRQLLAFFCSKAVNIVVFHLHGNVLKLRSCIVARVLMDIYHDRPFWVTVTSISGHEVHLHRYQKINVALEELCKIVYMKDELCSYPSDPHVIKEEARVNYLHYKPTAWRE